MPAGPHDYLVRLTLADLGRLDESAFETTAPEGGAVRTVCFWFFTAEAGGTQVMVNLGNRLATREGWSVFVRDGRLVVRACFPGGARAETSAALSDLDRWHHLAAVIDPDKREVGAYLDGSREPWRADEGADAVGADTVGADAVGADAVGAGRTLVVGGYTDAAGGHFDHTFGRRGSGFIDDLRLYARALGAVEIAPLAARGLTPPRAAFRLDPQGGRAPVEVQFDAGASDSDRPAATFLWDFGDGSRGEGERPRHRYRHGGCYRVRLTVVDERHAQATTERVFSLDGEPDPLVRTPVFVNGSEGYACFRIPAIVRAANGDLVAFAEGRVADCGDATPVSHIVSKSSPDGGVSWRPLCVVARNRLGGREYACMNPSPVVDTVHGTGRIVVVFNKLEASEWQLVRGEGVSRVCCVTSDDHGRSWGAEHDITLQVHRPYNPGYRDVYADAAREENRHADWRKQTPTLGHAIQLRGPADGGAVRGRLLYIGTRTEGAASVFMARNYAFWSDDLGTTWRVGAAIEEREDGSDAAGLNEATAVELESGAILVNSRHYRDGRVVGRRAVTVGRFDAAGDIRFGKVRHDPALVDSGVQASLLRFSRSDEAEAGARSRILFANPAHPRARLRLTVRLSYDEGRTWPIARLIDPGPSAYSDLVVGRHGEIGVLYERGNRGGVAFVSVDLAWLTDGADALPDRAPAT